MSIASGLSDLKRFRGHGFSNTAFLSSRSSSIVWESWAEFAGTFVLMFLGCSCGGAARIDKITGALQPGIVWGFSLSMAIFCSSSVSLAHLNPAISIAQAMIGKLPFWKLLHFISAQILGATAGAGIAFSFYSPVIEHFEQVNGIVRSTPESIASITMFQCILGDHISALRGFYIEVVITAVLTFILSALGDRHTEHGALRNLGPLCVGFTVAALTACFGPLSSACMNPARDMGPRIVAYAAGWGALCFPGTPKAPVWIYCAGPTLGAIIGTTLWVMTGQQAFVYADCVRPNDGCFALMKDSEAVLAARGITKECSSHLPEQNQATVNRLKLEKGDRGGSTSFRESQHPTSTITTCAGSIGPHYNGGVGAVTSDLRNDEVRDKRDDEAAEGDLTDAAPPLTTVMQQKSGRKAEVNSSSNADEERGERQPASSAALKQESLSEVTTATGARVRKSTDWEDLVITPGAEGVRSKVEKSEGREGSGGFMRLLAQGAQKKAATLSRLEVTRRGRRQSFTSGGEDERPVAVVGDGGTERDRDCLEDLDLAKTPSIELSRLGRKGSVHRMSGRGVGKGNGGGFGGAVTGTVTGSGTGTGTGSSVNSTPQARPRRE